MKKKPKTWIEGDVYHKVEQERNKLRMAGGAWTINLDTTRLDGIETFVYHSETHDYQISKVDALLKGFELPLQGENKLVVPLKNWITSQRGINNA